MFLGRETEFTTDFTRRTHLLSLPLFLLQSHNVSLYLSIPLSFTHYFLSNALTYLCFENSHNTLHSHARTLTHILSYIRTYTLSGTHLPFELSRAGYFKSIARCGPAESY